MRGMERTRFAPWGVHGGRYGGRTQPAVLNRGTNRERIIPKLDILILNRGDVLELASSGGGGYGDPCHRDPQRVLDDVLNGFVTEEAASEIYGVVLDDSMIDEERTDRKRAEIKRSRSKANGIYDYGPEREKHDRIWSPASRKAVVEILQSLPIPARSYAKTTMMRKALSLRSDRSLETITDAEIYESWALARTELGLEDA
jgi:N-methylhydantoinase B